MKFDVCNWMTGKVAFTAEIECDADASISPKLGLAVKWAIKSGADLSGAYLLGAYLSGADLSAANLSRAYLSGADLSGADLSAANLSRAYLSGADLSGANLSRAYLSGANLSRAYLSGANLSRAYLLGADGLAPELSTPLIILLDQPGKIRAYKLVTAEGMSPINGKKLKYEIGKSISVKNANTDPTEQCAAGVNVATLDWCLREWREGYRILIVEFEAADIACIPTATDRKFRLHRCDIVGEKQLDYVALGLVKAKEAEGAAA